MLITIAIVLGILLAAILGYAATRADSFRVQRTARIQAPPEKVFDLIQDFHRWSVWSPWERLDPAMKKTYTGAERGNGAVYQWAGNRKAGEGRMEITDTSQSRRVTIKLDFLKPFEGHNITEFQLEPKGSSTEVTWEMHGPQVYLAKVMSVFVSMDSMVGKDFEAGLAKMKAVAEK